MMLKMELMRIYLKGFTLEINGFLDFVHNFCLEELVMFEKLDLVLSHGCEVTVSKGVTDLHNIRINFLMDKTE
jgi:hypothetical protein